MVSGGITGSLLAGIFAAGSLGGPGLAEGVSVMDQVSAQTLSIVVTASWSALFSFLTLNTSRLVHRPAHAARCRGARTGHSSA